MCGCLRQWPFLIIFSQCRQFSSSLSICIFYHHFGDGERASVFLEWLGGAVSVKDFMENIQFLPCCFKAHAFQQPRGETHCVCCGNLLNSFFIWHVERFSRFFSLTTQPTTVCVLVGMSRMVSHHRCQVASYSWPVMSQTDTEVISLSSW